MVVVQKDCHGRPRDSSRSKSSDKDAAKSKDASNRGARVLFITAKDCERCAQELNRLRKPGGEFEIMQSRK